MRAGLQPGREVDGMMAALGREGKRVCVALWQRGSSGTSVTDSGVIEASAMALSLSMAGIRLSSRPRNKISFDR